VRLRWLLNALAEQTVAPEDLEVIVAHDAGASETQHLLAEHPLALTGHLRALAFAPGSVGPSAKRDAGWRAARAPLILFTDDDCRPPPDWVARARAAARAHPGNIIQGATRSDPDEADVLRGAPWAHTVIVEPPTVWAQTCNIVYPRELLERIDGFDHALGVGEDTDLARRAIRTGAQLVADPELLTYHAVLPAGLPGALRSLGRWGDMALLIKRHPDLRRHVFAGIWWKAEHAALAAAVTGTVLGRRQRRSALLAVPWVAMAMRHRGYGPRGLLRSLSELPGRAAIDAVETAVLAAGSVRHRTVLL
jgi:glycosyltransferase involved in cell wall biosynthesis